MRILKRTIQSYSEALIDLRFFSPIHLSLIIHIFGWTAISEQIHAKIKGAKDKIKKIYNEIRTD